MRSTLPYDPRSSHRGGSGWVERVGRGTIAWFSEAWALFGTLRDAVAADFAPGVAARRLTHAIMMTQVLFTGVQALSLVSIIGLLIGASIIIQTNMMVPADGELIGRVLVAVVLRELAPLITAIVVAGRSGTAIATELGNMKVNSEMLALSSLGVDPMRYVVLPRMVGCVVSVVARKRIAIARALAVNPNFVFLDDPDSGLDSSTRHLVYERLLKFRDDSTITVVVATNSQQLIDRLGIHPMELAHGHLLPEDATRRSRRA